jgi:hypothetical protein
MNSRKNIRDPVYFNRASEAPNVLDLVDHAIVLPVVDAEIFSNNECNKKLQSVYVQRSSYEQPIRRNL